MSLKTKLRNYLDVEGKDWTEDFEKIEHELWKHQQLLKKRVSVVCPVCTKLLKLWPLEEEAYYTKDGKHYHVKCYEKMLEKKDVAA